MLIKCAGPALVILLGLQGTYFANLFAQSCIPPKVTLKADPVWQPMGTCLSPLDSLVRVKIISTHPPKFSTTGEVVIGGATTIEVFATGERRIIGCSVWGETGEDFFIEKQYILDHSL